MAQEKIDAMLINENLHVELQDRRHPYVDVYEKEIVDDQIRSARLDAIALISAFASGIANAMADPRASLQSVAVAFWSRCLALSLPCAQGVSVSALALSLGVTKATLSKSMIEFSSAHGLPPSRWMKSEASRTAYAQARVDYVKRNGNGQSNAKAESLPVPPARGRSV